MPEPSNQEEAALALSAGHSEDETGRSLLICLGGLLFFLIIVPAVIVLGLTARPAHQQNLKVRIYLAGSHRLLQIGLEEYLTGVLAAEMPANFCLEALKAQAIAARTLTVRRLKCYGGRGCRHDSRADLSDQPDDGQAWLPESALKKLWGRKYAENLERIRLAVRETSGLVILYDHRLIEAAYHSTCGGRTEDASAVWAGAFPYLTSVKCEDDRFSPRYLSQSVLSWSELFRRLNLPAALPHQCRILALTAAGRAAKVSAGGRTITGAFFRQALALRSTNFTLQPQPEGILIRVRGNGHGVGLCQYGAEGLARKGADYWQILRHYYTGVALGRLRM